MIRRTAALLAALCLVSSAESGEGWYSTYEEARDAAEASRIPLLLHFHASYCGPCRQMSAQVFSQPQVQNQLRNGLAGVEVDVQYHAGLARQYGATTVPRDVVVFPDGSHETLNVGFKSTFAYMDLLRTIARRGARYAKPKIESPAPAPEVRPQPQEIIATPDRIGLEGFCPVRLIRDQRWVSGQEKIQATYRGITYYFASVAEQELFLQDPSKLTPQNLGCDPVVLYSDQQAVTGDIRYGAFFDSKLFLFDTPDSRTAFKQNPLKYSQIRHALKVDELQDRRIQ